MPALVVSEASDRKRKRPKDVSTGKADKPRKAAKLDGSAAIKTRILQLEKVTLDEQDRHDALAQLTAIYKDSTYGPNIVDFAAVTLCRIFCRLIASEEMISSKELVNMQSRDAQTLRASFREFKQDMIESFLEEDDNAFKNTAIMLLMRIVKEELLQDPRRANTAWAASSTFGDVISILLSRRDAYSARQLFVERYVEEHDDVRYHTFQSVKHILEDKDHRDELYASNTLDLLAHIEGVPDSQDQLEDWYGRAPEKKSQALLSLSSHRKVAQDAWLALFRTELTHEHRKKILRITSSHITPWFSDRLEILADFLTDSFNTPGSTSLLALGGLFYLMTQRNMDYPDFYPKLYSLLDANILHSKHRSQFLRLLDRCLASTHLPAALVASFMKRLSRLALQAPPGAIVWVVPWIYNLLRQHPTCTFMLHRPEHPAHAIYASNPNPSETGMIDPFDMNQKDPMLTGAIDSSLWEIQALQSHYHPNVATLSNILDEQFTKRDYQLEDFLDHSYASLLDAELSRKLKKEPVVEWDIPKHIVTAEGDTALNPLGTMLQETFDVTSQSGR